MSHLQDGLPANTVIAGSSTAASLQQRITDASDNALRNTSTMTGPAVLPALAMTTRLSEVSTQFDQILIKRFPSQLARLHPAGLHAAPHASGTFHGVADRVLPVGAAIHRMSPPHISGSTRAHADLQAAPQMQAALLPRPLPEESRARLPDTSLHQRIAAIENALNAGPSSSLHQQHSFHVQTLHKPPQFGEDIKRRSASDLRAHINTVSAYMDRIGADFVSDIRFWFSWHHMAWIQNLLLSRPNLTRAEFSSELVNYCTGQVRSESVLALEALIKGHVTQGSSSATDYAQRFLNITRVLPNETQISLCKHYINGLTPALRARACLTRENQEWTDLQSCIQYSYSEEYRMSFEAPLAPPEMQHEQYPPPPKRRKDDHGYSHAT